MIDTKKRSRQLAQITIAFFGLIIYLNAITMGYCLDDGVVITENVFTKKGVAGIPNIFKYDTFLGSNLTVYAEDLKDVPIEEVKNDDLTGGRYRPLSLVTFALEIELWGQGHPYVSHLINILLYLGLGLLIYSILLRLFPPKDEQRWYLTMPFIASMVFMAHPLHTEVVANIKSRDEIMAFLGALGALWFTLRYYEAKKEKKKSQMVGALILSFLCMLAGSFSKENAITYVAIIPVTIIFFGEDKSFKHLAITTLPLVLGAGIFVAARMVFLGGFVQNIAIHGDLLNNPFLDATTEQKYATIALTMLKYLSLCFFPHPLTWDYYPYYIPLVTWTDWRAIVGLTLIVAMTIWSFIGLFKKHDVVSYAFILYLVPLSIVSNVVFQVGTFMAERFVFFSSLGYALFIGYFAEKIINKSKIGKVVCLSILTIMLVFYSVKTIGRNHVWGDSEDLIKTDYRTSEGSAKSANSIGTLCAEKILYGKVTPEDPEYERVCTTGIRYLQKSIEIIPESTEQYFAIAILWNNYKHNTVKALEYIFTALRVAPYDNNNYEYLDKILDDALIDIDKRALVDDPDEILTACEAILQYRDDLPSIWELAGVIHGQIFQDLPKSISCFEKALELGYDRCSLYNYMATATFLNGEKERSAECYENILRLNPTDDITYEKLIYVYEKLGEFDKAKKYRAVMNDLRRRKAMAQSEEMSQQ